MGRQKLIDYICQFAAFNEEEKSIIAENVYERSYKQNEYFLEKGKKETEMAFILSGVFRFFFYDEQGNEVITTFLRENHFATILSVYTEIDTSPVYIQSVTNSKTINVNRNAWDLFSDKIPSWRTAMQKISMQYFVEKTRHQRSIIKLNADESYRYFAKLYPTVLERVPLSYIANYLGITPFSLSRIRKQLNKK